MNDSLTDHLAYFLRRRGVRLGIVAIVVLLIAWAIIATLLQPPALKAQPIGITIANTIESKGNAINVYNGNSFYTIDTANNNAMKVVYTPTYRLPTFNTMTWADNKGALLTFKSGIINTPVYDYFTAHDIDTTSGSLYTWYLDFTTGELSIVGEFDIDGTVAYYSQKDQGFFFAPLDLSESSPDNNSLWYYDVNKKSSRVVIESFNTTIQSMQQCNGQDGSVCIIGHRSDDNYSTNRLVSVSKNSTSATTLYTLTGKIIPTPITNTYVLLSGIDNSKQDNEDELFRMSTYYKKIQTLNLSTKDVRDYSGTIYETTVVAGTDGDNLYLMDGETNEVVWLRDGSLFSDSKTETIVADEKASINEGVTIVDTQLSPNILVAGVDGSVYMISKNLISTPQVADSTRATDAVEECANYANSKTSTNGSIYTILVEDNERFNEVSNHIKQCIARKPEIMLGYTYLYRGYSGINGRISTD